jgi:hypothetical protein
MTIRAFFAMVWCLGLIGVQFAVPAQADPATLPLHADDLAVLRRIAERIHACWGMLNVANSSHPEACYD